MCTKMSRCFLVIATLAIMGLTGLNAAAEPRRGGELVVSYGGGTPRHFNPAVQSGTSTAIVGTQIFASPTSIR